jgi:hypothetical protein
MFTEYITSVTVCAIFYHYTFTFSKPDPQKTGPPWILADVLSPWQTVLCKGSLSKPATHLNWPYFLVSVLAGLGKFRCTYRYSMCLLSTWLLFQCVPYLISMCTDTEKAIRVKADQQLQEIDKKYPGFIHVSKCCFFSVLNIHSNWSITNIFSFYLWNSIFEHMYKRYTWMLLCNFYRWRPYKVWR